jgi:hypothetical protein
VRGPPGAERLAFRRQLPGRVWQATVVLVRGGFGARVAHHLAGDAVPVGEEASRPGARRRTGPCSPPGGRGGDTIARLFGGNAAGLIARICGYPACRNPADPWFPLRRRRALGRSRRTAPCDGKGLSPQIHEMCRYGGIGRLRFECVSSFVRKRCVRRHHRNVKSSIRCELHGVVGHPACPDTGQLPAVDHGSAIQRSQRHSRRLRCRPKGRLPVSLRKSCDVTVGVIGGLWPRHAGAGCVICGC